jgi:hypothetical protein
MAGRFNFSSRAGRMPRSSTWERSRRRAAAFAALVAPGRAQLGHDTANLGSVALGPATIFTLDFYGDKLITLGDGDQIAAR